MYFIFYRTYYDQRKCTGTADSGRRDIEFSSIFIKIQGLFGATGDGDYTTGGGGGAEAGGGGGGGLTTLGGGVGGFCSFSEEEGVYQWSCSGYKFINIIAKHQKQ